MNLLGKCHTLSTGNTIASCTNECLISWLKRSPITAITDATCVFALLKAILQHRTSLHYMWHITCNDWLQFLADRSRACYNVSSDCLSVTSLYCGQNGASCSKSYYWQLIGSSIWRIDWYQNEWPWPLFRGRLRSCQPLRHISRWISREPLEIKDPKGSPTENDLRWRDRWCHVTLKVVTPIRLKPNISKTAGDAIATMANY